MGPSSVIRKTVALEAHRLIQTSVEEALEKLRVGMQTSSVAYPPGATVPAAALAALERWNPDDGALAALRALITDACASSMFRLFALLDGVADPEVRDAGAWLGANLTAIDGDEHREMLHDMFFETWEEYERESARD